MPEHITEEGSGARRAARGCLEGVIQAAKSPGSRIDAIVKLIDREIPPATTTNNETDWSDGDGSSSSERLSLRGVDATTASLRSSDSAGCPRDLDSMRFTSRAAGRYWLLRYEDQEHRFTLRAAAERWASALETRGIAYQLVLHDGSRSSSAGAVFPDNGRSQC